MGTREDEIIASLPMRVLHLERDVTALDARCRECSVKTQGMLRSLSIEISSFAHRIVEDLLKINSRIDSFVKDHGPSCKGKRKGKRKS